MKLYLIKRNYYAVPVDDNAREMFKKIPEGAYFEVKNANQRVVWYHRKFFLMLSIVFQNLPEAFDEYYPTSESLRRALLLLAGHTVTYRMPDGTERIEADSIAFDKIGQAEFEQVYNACVNAAIKHFGLPESIKMELALNF